MKTITIFNHVILSTLFLATISVRSLQADPYTDGRDAYEAGDYTAAMNSWKPAAEGGDQWAQYALAHLYTEGLGAEKNLVAAVYWLERAALQGLPMAQFRLGNAHSEGYGFPKNDKEAVRWWRYAADQGVVDAMYNLGVHYYFGRGVEKDRDKAFEWLEKAAEAGHEQAQNIVLAEQAGRAGLAEEDRPANEEVAPVQETQATQTGAGAGAVSGPAQTTVAATETADAAPVPGSGPKNESWILARPPDHFTMQLAAMSDHAGVKRYIDKHGIEGQIAVYQRGKADKMMMVIILGDFPDRDAAELARSNLPGAVKKQRPWIRQIAEIQSIIQSN